MITYILILTPGDIIVGIPDKEMELASSTVEKKWRFSLSRGECGARLCLSTVLSARFTAKFRNQNDRIVFANQM